MKCALITGASRGIGRAIALALAEAHNNLILVAKEDEAGLKETASLVAAKNEGREFLYVSTQLLDVSDSKAVSDFFKRLKDSGIEVEILVNNAGIAHFNLVQDMSDADWHKVLGTNLDSAFYMARAVVPQMVHNKSGKIINISSYWGQAGASMESAYAASKGGLNAFTLSLAEELELSNIQVNAISVEFVDTVMNAHLSKEEAEEAASYMPSGKIIKPEVIGKLAAKLSSPDCKVTGKIVSQSEEI